MRIILLLTLILAAGFVFLGLPCRAVPEITDSSKFVGKKDEKKPQLQSSTGLTFTQDRVAVTAAPDAKKVTVPYTFENKTGRTLTISRYDSACSCLSMKVKGSKLVYKPGEKGEMKVDFELGSFSGTVEKTVLLWTTDDPEDAPSSVLTVALTIPKLFDLAPLTLFWDQSGEKSTQVIKMKVNHTVPIRIINHMGTNKDFDYVIKTIRDGWEYDLLVTPKNVDVPAFGMIKITTDSAIPRYQRQQAFVCVRRSKK